MLENLHVTFGNGVEQFTNPLTLATFENSTWVLAISLLAGKFAFALNKRKK